VLKGVVITNGGQLDHNLMMAGASEGGRGERPSGFWNL